MMAWRVYFACFIGRFNNRVNEIQPEGGQAAQPINQRSEQRHGHLNVAIKSIKILKGYIQSNSWAKVSRVGSLGFLYRDAPVTMHKGGTI